MHQALLPVVQQQIRYHDWAIREMWRGLRSLPEAELSIPRGTSYDTILATLTHMYMADRVWLNRLSGEGSIQIAAIPVPAPTLLEEVWHETLDGLCSWTESLTDDRLSATIHYADSSGTRFDTPIWQVLLHVVNHGSGHRGQVTGMLRQGGGLPFSTDLIQFHRNPLQVGTAEAGAVAVTFCRGTMAGGCTLSLIGSADEASKKHVIPLVMANAKRISRCIP